MVELVDSKGRRDPKAENLIDFAVKGDGKIIGVGNANPLSLESFQQPYRKAWKGRCMVIVKAGKTAGNITVTARSKGLKPVQLTLTTKSGAQ
jgi:beta-galactosidase